MQVAEAAGLISRAIETGRAANGYLVCGEVEGVCTELAEAVLRRLFPGMEEQIARRSHPDIAWLVPQGKSRTIKIKRGKDDDGPGMRDGLLDRIDVTSYSGGWKAGVVAHADRMQEEASNAFLKVLEEPPPRTMFLLLTSAPEAILPTIVSRTQRIDLPEPPGLLQGDLYAAMERIFAGPAPEGAFGCGAAGAELAAILAAAAAEKGDAAAARKAFFRTVLSFFRNWMAERRLPAYLAYRNIEACEIAFRQCEKAMSPDAVLPLMMDRTTFP